MDAERERVLSLALGAARAELLELLGHSGHSLPRRGSDYPYTFEDAARDEAEFNAEVAGALESYQRRLNQLWEESLDMLREVAALWVRSRGSSLPLEEVEAEATWIGRRAVDRYAASTPTRRRLRPYATTVVLGRLDEWARARGAAPVEVPRHLKSAPRRETLQEDAS